jgi:hypothetical protein
MITLLVLSLILIVTLGSVFMIFNRKTSKNSDSAETWHKLMMSRIDK